MDFSDESITADDKMKYFAGVTSDFLRNREAFILFMLELFASIHDFLRNKVHIKTLIIAGAFTAEEQAAIADESLHRTRMLTPQEKAKKEYRAKLVQKASVIFGNWKRWIYGDTAADDDAIAAIGSAASSPRSGSPRGASPVPDAPVVSPKKRRSEEEDMEHQISQLTDANEYETYSNPDSEDGEDGEEAPKVHKGRWKPATKEYLAPKQDLFETSPMVTHQLMRFLEGKGVIGIGATVFEPCYGKGAIAKVFEDAGYKVIARDLYTMDEKHDYLKAELPEVYDIMVTNPPYSDKHNFILHAYRSGMPFAMLIPVQTLTTLRSGVLCGQRGAICLMPLPCPSFKRANGKSFSVGAVCWLIGNVGKNDTPYIPFYLSLRGDLDFDQCSTVAEQFATTDDDVEVSSVLSPFFKPSDKACKGDDAMDDDATTDEPSQLADLNSVGESSQKRTKT